MFNRYKELKFIYKKYLILLKKQNRLITFNEDKTIINYLRVKTIQKLEKHEINYIILDNLFIEQFKEYENNNYDNYYLKVFLIDLVNKIKEKLR